MPSPPQLQLINAEWCQGVGPGYWPTGIGAGLVLNLSSGTSFVNGAVQFYSAGTLTMTDNSTNYIYLDSTGTPQTKTTTFVPNDIPIAIVVTISGAIVSIVDVRQWFVMVNRPYFISYFQGDNNLTGPLGNSQNLLTHKFPSSYGGVAVNGVTFPVSLTGSVGGCLVNPTSAATITINKNGSSVGTINISTGGVMTFTFTLATTFAASDVISFVNQASADATLAGVYFTISGVRA